MLEFDKNDAQRKINVEYRYDTKGMHGKFLGNSFVLVALLLAVVVIRSGRWIGLLLVLIVWIFGLAILNMDKYYKQTLIKMTVNEVMFSYHVMKGNEILKKFDIPLKEIEEIGIKVGKIFSPGVQNGVFRFHKMLYSFEVLTSGAKHELFRDSNFNDNLQHTIDLKKLFELATEMKVKVPDTIVEKELRV